MCKFCNTHQCNWSLQIKNIITSASFFADLKILQNLLSPLNVITNKYQSNSIYLSDFFILYISVYYLFFINCKEDRVNRSLCLVKIRKRIIQPLKMNTCISFIAFCMDPRYNKCITSKLWLKLLFVSFEVHCKKQLYNKSNCIKAYEILLESHLERPQLSVDPKCYFQNTLH